jgi:ribosome-associated protein
LDKIEETNIPKAAQKNDPKSNPLDHLVNSILSSLDDDKAQDVLAIDLVGKTSIADRMIIATGTSARMVSAMADHLLRKLKDAGVKVQTEGEKHGDWVVVDAGDVIVHLFRPEVRAFYSIERIWQAPVSTAGTSPTKPKPKSRMTKKPAAPRSAAAKGTATKKPAAKKPAARKPARRA